MQKRDPTTNQLFVQQAISADAPAAKKQVASILAKARAVGCAGNGFVKKITWVRVFVKCCIESTCLYIYIWEV